MTAWQLTAGLDNLRRQVNARWPGRDKASDGTIGDAAHQAEVSGHNPDDTPGSRPEWDGDPDTMPEVRAWDMDSDLREPGTTAQMVVDHIRGLPGVSNVLRYMIYASKIYQASNGWAAETYTGPSKHDEHIHFSGARSQAADQNTTYDYRLGAVPPMSLTPEDLKQVRSQAASGVVDVLVGAGLAADPANGNNPDVTPANRQVRNAVWMLLNNAARIDGIADNAEAILTRLTAIETALSEILDRLPPPAAV